MNTESTPKYVVTSCWTHRHQDTHCGHPQPLPGKYNRDSRKQWKVRTTWLCVHNLQRLKWHTSKLYPPAQVWRVLCYWNIYITENTRIKTCTPSCGIVVLRKRFKYVMTLTLTLTFNLWLSHLQPLSASCITAARKSSIACWISSSRSLRHMGSRKPRHLWTSTGKLQRLTPRYNM